MRLTTAIRDAFVRAVMNDVPKVDYSEEARKLVLQDNLAQMPSKIRQLARDVSTEHFLRTIDWWGRFNNFNTMTVYCARGEKYQPSEDVKARLAELDAAANLQNETRNDLSKKLNAVALSVTTRKALAAALPEFEKYLPADNAAALRTVPVIQNVVTDFVKAGWPNGKKPTATTKK